MNAGEKRAKFRSVLSGHQTAIADSVFDPISARIADRVGFEIGLMGGSLASFTVLGAPDLILITLSELAEQCKRSCRASRVSLLVDADHGYGNALNVMRTVEELEAAGVAALTIEDTLLPRRFGAGGAAELTSIEEGVGKMKAALAARRDPGLVIVGRTSATAISSLDDAIVRLRAYAAAGVDALMVPGIKNRAELDRIADAVSTPLIIGGSSEELSDLTYLASRHVRAFSYGHQAFAASVKAIHDTMMAVRNGTPAAKLANIADKELMEHVTRAADFTARAKAYLGS
jgi:carboxyvinyl-carboxyphosphonate phosphorylmutase